LHVYNHLTLVAGGDFDIYFPVIAQLMAWISFILIVLKKPIYLGQHKDDIQMLEALKSNLPNTICPHCKVIKMIRIGIEERQSKALF